MTTRQQGQAGEALAARYLADAGYAIEATNYGCRQGEVDIIAWDRDVLCFVEVRTRVDTTHGHPLETVQYPKMRRIIAAARAYLRERHQDLPKARFDVLGIVLGDPPSFHLVRGAFDTTGPVAS